MTLQIAIRQTQDATIVDLNGRIIMGEPCDALSRSVRGFIDAGVRKIILNLENVSQVDSTGISVIVRTFVTLTRDNGSLVLLRPSGRVRQVLEVMRLPLSIRAFEDEPAAIAAVSEPHPLKTDLKH